MATTPTAGLTIHEERLTDRRIALTITVPDERKERALRKAAAQLGRRVKVPGYRPGKAPYEALVRTVGEETVHNKAIESLAVDALSEALAERDLRPYGSPEVDITGRDPLEIRAVVPLEPTVDLGRYLNIRLPYEPPELPERDVEAALEDVRRNSAVLVPAGRPTQEGDHVTLDARAVEGDAAIVEFVDRSVDLTPQGLTNANLPTSLLPHLLGLHVGSSAEITARYEHDFADRALAGRQLKFRVELVDVRAYELPELDDDLARSLDYQTLDELRASIRARLAARNEALARARYRDQLADLLVSTAVAEYPPSALEAMVDRLLEEYKTRLARELPAMSWERWLALNETHEDRLRSDLLPEARRELKQALVFSEFMEREDISCGEAELENEVRMLTGVLKGNQLSMSEMRKRARSRVLSRKTMERLEQIADPERFGPDGAGSQDPNGELDE
jgi:trigger factor